MKRSRSDLCLFQKEEKAHTRHYYPTWSEDEVASCMHQCQLMANDHNYSISINGGFIEFARNTHEDELLCPSRGVKFHVSLSHDRSNYCEGIKIVMKVLFELEMTPFKIVHPSSLSIPQYTEAGREITIYTLRLREAPIINNQFNAHLSKLIETINNQLTSASILPYQNEKKERTMPVKDSEISKITFVSWRDDRKIYGFYVPKLHGIGLYQPNAVNTEEEQNQQYNKGL